MSNKLIRNSTAEFLIFTGQAGEQSIEARREDQSIWLNQELLAKIFCAGIRTVATILDYSYRGAALLMAIPSQPKIYHIVHVDRLASIIADQVLWSDAQVIARAPAGTTIGMSGIKQRRLTELTLTSHPDLNVGACVPFYLCPRSIMLYMIYQSNHPDLGYKGGQGPIIHLEADLNDSVAWAEANQQRWAFTLSNAGSYYFEDRSDLSRLNEINWTAVEARNWMSCKDGKQAEFLLENCYPWHLVERVGVCSQAIYTKVANILAGVPNRPDLQIKPDWYY